MLAQVQRMFLQAFGVALGVDGEEHLFTFSDGYTTNGRLYEHITCLQIKDGSSYMHSHTHGLNNVLPNSERVFMLRACDVPDRALLLANAYLDIDENQYQILSATLKDMIWTLHLQICGTAVGRGD